MANIRSVNEIILSLIDFFKLTQPDLDTKPGTVARDLFIDAPSTQLSLLYDELSNISDKQSLRLVVGSDLDKLAKNFGLTRTQATQSSGVALLTFSSIDAPININKGSTIIANNNSSFVTVSNLAVSPSNNNYYRSLASRYRNELDIVGISDQYAVEITVTASTAGTVGNIGKFALKRTTIPGVSNVTNINSFTGGTDQETDPVFRNRVLSSFAGASVGTSLGYQNAALSVDGVNDAAVIEPGDPLMSRDGTITTTNADGSKTVVSEGTGGKVDVVVLGSFLQENVDSYIYQDKSNNNDPTSSKNDFVLGQISGDENKTINRKRVDNISTGQLPAQPVNQILQVSGSISGANFVEKTVDSLGRVSGNYELIKDTGVYGGSPWGFDTFHWISNKISLFEDDKVKGQFNGQDATTFTDVLQIPLVRQNLSITNEDSTVTFDRSIIQLLHTPVVNVTRVFNVNTGERYVITSQNVDGTGTLNTTGRIQISGNTLPTQSDILQVDYVWAVSYDQYSDYDGLVNTSNERTVTDSVDWGYSSLVRDELITFTESVGNNYFIGTASHPVSTVITANKSTEVDATVTQVTAGVFVGRLSVTLSNLSVATSTIDSVKLKNTNAEQYNTAQADGSFTSVSAVVGINIVYNTTIILPTDCTASAGDRVTVLVDGEDVFHTTSTVGSSTGTQITIPSSQINTTGTSITLAVSYIANISEFYSSAVTSLPSSRTGSGFSLLNNNGFNNFSIVNNSRREAQNVQQNLSLQYYVELNLPATDYSLNASQIVSVIRLSDGYELWDIDYPGTITTGTSGNYQVILSGAGTPTTFDRALVIYYAYDIKRYQPFTYQNSIIKYRLDNLAIDPGTGKFTVPISNFVSTSSMSFDVIEPNTNIALFSVTDGYLTNNGSTATIGSYSQSFASLPDLTNKKVKIFNTVTANTGTFDITSYNVVTNTITISSSLDNIDYNQICVVRVLDGQEIWNNNGIIDIANNKLLFPAGTNANFNDNVFVMYFNYLPLKQSLTRLAASITDTVINTGTITAAGTTITKAENIVFTATASGLKLNLIEAMRKALGINSATAIPANLRVAKVASLERVTTASNSSDEVVSVLTTYDIKNTTIKNNLYYANDCLSDSTLQNLEFILPATQNNTLNTDTRNLPRIGDKLRVTFYYVNESDSDSLAYTRNGVLYTNKKFALINRLFVSSGFKSSQSTRLSLSSFTQPNIGARYKIYYDYLAPKQNERIVIDYNYNKIISDVTFRIEDTRPINADVLVRAAKNVELDLTMNIVIDDAYKSSTATILQNVRDQLTTALTSTLLGQLIDQITLINVAQGVTGIARARILYFNKTGLPGQVIKVQAQRDEFFTPNNIIINTESR